MKTQRTFALKLFALSFTSCIVTALAPVSTAWAHSQPPYSTVRVSVSSKGVQGNGNSYGAQISANGRFVVFRSSASNLVAADHNGVDDVFVHDLKTRKTKRVSVSSAGVEGNGGSGDGFSFPRDRHAFISANGRYVAFMSDASNLVSGDGNGQPDIFVHDTQTGVTRRLFLDNLIQPDYLWDIELTSLSDNGRFVAFTWYIENIDYVQAYVSDLKTGLTQNVSSHGDYLLSFSANGRFAVLSSFFGTASKCLNFGGYPSTLILSDLKTGENQCVDTGDFTSPFSVATLSANARFLAYKNDIGELLVYSTNFNRPPHHASVNRAGVEGNGVSFGPDLSANGHFVAFSSLASDLVARDKNETFDVFVRDLKAGVTRRVSVNSAGKGGNKGSSGASISADGHVVAFISDADNLVNGDTNGKKDVFVHFCRR